MCFEFRDDLCCVTMEAMGLVQPPWLSLGSLGNPSWEAQRWSFFLLCAIKCQSCGFGTMCGDSYMYPSTRRLRQEGCYKFKATLSYTLNSRAIQATE